MSEICSSCGTGFDDPDFRAFQENKLDAPALCKDCISQIKSHPHIQSAFDTIRASLPADKRADWDDASFEDKLLRFLSLHKNGIITPSDTLGKSKRDFGSLSTLQLVRAYLVKLQYQDTQANPETQDPHSNHARKHRLIRDEP